MELIISPDIIFLDEPTTGLDATTAVSVIKLLKEYVVNDYFYTCATKHLSKCFVAIIYNIQNRLQNQVVNLYLQATNLTCNCMFNTVS